MKLVKSSILFGLLCVLIFIYLTYGIDRVTHKYFVEARSFFGLIVGSMGLFVSAYYLSKRSWTIPQLVIFGIGIRLITLVALPNLSDDYFRYLWDGTLSLKGINPFDFLPNTLINTPEMPAIGLNQIMYEGFNSQGYYSVYPPFVQGIFSLAVWLGGDSLLLQIIVLRMCVLLAELGSIFFLIKLLVSQSKRPEWALFYILNPLILLEFSVNLHTEVFMVTFILAALYFIKEHKLVLAGSFWGLAISAKLLPLMFLPLFFRYLGLKNSLKFYFVTLSVALLSFLPFYNATLLPHIKESIDLYFGTFQFNGSLVYLLNYIGKSKVGYDLTFQIMPILSKVFVVVIALFGALVPCENTSKLWYRIMIFYLIYLLLAATVHPWYITLFVPFSILLNKKWGLGWSFLVLLTYAAYFTPIYTEYPIVIWIEYLGLFALFALEKRYTT